MEAAAKASAVIPDAAPTVTEEIDDDVTRAVADAERARRVAAGTAAGAIAASGPAAESGASVGEDRIAAAAAQTTELLGRFRPGQEHAPAEVGPAAVHPDEQPVRETHLAAETVESPPVVSLSAAAIAADEAVEAIRRAAIESGPAVEPTIEPPTAQPVAAASEPAAQPAVEPLPGVAAEPGPAAPEPAPIPTPSRDDRVEAPVWQIVAPETADTTSGATPIPTPQPVESPRPSAQAAPTNGAGQNGSGTGPQWPTPATTPPPQWPMPASQPSPQWPTRAAVTPVATDMWAASSQDVLNRPGSGVSACVSCGLPLSAAARFCRRCGSSQH